MPVEGTSCNGSVKLEEPPREGLITYKRKRTRSRFGRDPVLCHSSRKRRERDIGWDHGEIIDGNRFHWMCNWCGMIRYGGGVSRLKKHLAGVSHVRKCPSVPDDIAKFMKNHLMEKQKERANKLSYRSTHHVGLLDKEKKSNVEAQMDNITGSSKGALVGSAGLTKEFVKQEKVIIQTSGSAHRNDMKAKVGSATGITSGAQVGSATELTKAAFEQEETISQKCRSSQKSDLEVQGGDTTRFATGAQIKGSAGLNEQAIKQDMFIFKRFRSAAHTSDMETQVGTAKGNGLIKGYINRPKISIRRSRSAIQQSKTTNDQLKAGMSKHGMKDIHDTVSCTNTYKQDQQATMNCNWKNVLKCMLGLPGISEGGGILNCIHDALTYGHSGFTTKLDIIGFSTGKAQDAFAADLEVKGQNQKPDSSVNAGSCASRTRSFCQTDTINNTIMCQKLFVDILCSEKFALLCDLFWRNFQEKAKFFFDFNLINSRMKNGEYEHSPELFDQDIQQVWDKIQKVGQEMVLLASSLSSMSRFSCQKQELCLSLCPIVGTFSDPKLVQVGGGLVREVDGHKHKETCQEHVERKNSLESHATTHFTCESEQTTKLNQTEAYCPYETCTCKQCGREANAESSLICDQCEGTYHFSCVEPAVKEIPTRSWYCSACSMCSKDSPDPASNSSKKNSLHQNCVVCERLEVSVSKDDIDEDGSRTALAGDSRESSASSMESGDPPELSRTAVSCLCKICGTCEDAEKRFLICGHTQCPYKFYHIRCLKSSQIASPQQQNKPCWYCPSCLCRACLCDKDDDQIVLCDGCDEAYHTYCMKPPRASIPKGQWYCVPCNVARAKEGMKRYEQWILQQHRKNDVTHSSETNRSMDLLLSAAETLRSEEQVAAEC